MCCEYAVQRPAHRGRKAKYYDLASVRAIADRTLAGPHRL